jgi:ABC-type phosphonate transport system ATPase subunit
MHGANENGAATAHPNDIPASCRAHRLPTVQRADKVLILERGQIVEFGLRQQLADDPTSHFAQLLRTGMEEALV